MAFKPNYRRDRARIVPDPPEATTLGFLDAEFGTLAFLNRHGHALNFSQSYAPCSLVGD